MPSDWRADLCVTASSGSARHGVEDGLDQARAFRLIVLKTIELADGSVQRLLRNPTLNNLVVNRE